MKYNLFLFLNEYLYSLENICEEKINFITILNYIILYNINIELILYNIDYIIFANSDEEKL